MHIMDEKFEVHGYGDFIENVLPVLDRIFDEILGDPEGHFTIALIEAVNNAARYAKAGMDEAEIKIHLEVYPGDIKISVNSDTKDFDVKMFCRDIKKLGEDKKWQLKDFGCFKKDRLSGRGIWLMLEACDYLCIDVKDKTVTLCTSYPAEKKYIQNIASLASRLYMCENGVIYQ